VWESGYVFITQFDNVSHRRYKRTFIDSIVYTTESEKVTMEQITDKIKEMESVMEEEKDDEIARELIEESNRIAKEEENYEKMKKEMFG